jgi:NAD(P)-dependent dehydrogenase (short-subunit alcohol dehydrogenase family)
MGGSSGIGFATARLLARDGARVTITGRDGVRLHDAVDQLGREELVVRSEVCDACDAEAVQAAVDSASEGASLDIAVCIPGGAVYTSIFDYGDDDFGAQIDENVRPVFLLIKYACDAMTEGGSFVAVSSSAAAFSCRYLAAYCAAKSAVDALVRVTADELGERNIRVNSVRPGLTRTAVTQAIVKEPFIYERFLHQQPLARLGEAEDVAAAIRFLAGPESSWVTGQHISVDGGHTLRAFPDMGDLVRMIKERTARR